MKGYDLCEAIAREVRKKGTLSSQVKCLDESGEIFNIVEVEDEQQPDGSHVLWLKLEVDDGSDDDG